MSTAAALYPAQGEKMGRHFARFDPRRGVNGLKRSIDSPLLLFAHHTAAIDQSAKVCVNLHRDWQLPSTDYPLNNWCQ